MKKYIMIYGGAGLLGSAGGSFFTVAAFVGLAAVVHGIFLALEEVW
jgi:uncharacterized membrane protein HdeD (DUF308 family)